MVVYWNTEDNNCLQIYSDWSISFRQLAHKSGKIHLLSTYTDKTGLDLLGTDLWLNKVCSVLRFNNYIKSRNV